MNGRVNADDFPSLQAAVDALSDVGGEVKLSARTYILKQPVVLKNRIRFQGVMDSKDWRSVTKIQPAPDFTGEWLFVTKAVPAKGNPDLNLDLFFFDLDMGGSTNVGGIYGLNIDTLRIERCRLAGLKNGIRISQLTDLPRPWHWAIAPGGAFINNSVFKCSDTAIQIEYATQNRIYANWFVGGGKTIFHLKNSDKTWFYANELNNVKDSSIIIEDDGLPGNTVHEIFISLNWLNLVNPGSKFLDLRPNGKHFERVQVINNIFEGVGTCDTAALDPKLGNRFEGNTGTQPGVASQAAGRFEIKSNMKAVKIEHGLYKTPVHVGITFENKPPVYWVSAKDEKSFTVSFDEPISTGAFTWIAVAAP